MALKKQDMIELAKLSIAAEKAARYPEILKRNHDAEHGQVTKYDIIGHHRNGHEVHHPMPLQRGLEAVSRAGHLHGKVSPFEKMRAAALCAAARIP